MPTASLQSFSQHPVLSIYVPLKDPEPQMLQAVVDGIFAQSYPFEQLILVDDGSARADLLGLLSSLASNPRIQLVQHARNFGVAHARNTAVNVCGAPLLCAFDADIVPEPDCVAQLVSALGTHPAIGGVGGRVRELHQDTPGDRFRGFFMKQDRGEQRLEGVELFGGCTLYPTELLRNVGGYFSPLRNSFEDFDICHRVQRAGKQTVYTPMAKGWHHKRDSITSALDTLFSWSYPHWEDGSWIFSYDWLKNVDAKEPPRFYYQELVSSSIARLSYKINSQLPANLARLEQEGITSELRLLAGVFVVRSIVKDLKIFQQLNTSCDSAVRNEVLTLAEDAIVAVLSSSGCSTFGREYVALIEDLLGGKGLRDFGGETLQSFLLRVKSRSLPEEAIDLLAVILEGLGQLPHRLQGVSASDLRAESSKR